MSSESPGIASIGQRRAGRNGVGGIPTSIYTCRCLQSPLQAGTRQYSSVRRIGMWH